MFGGKPRAGLASINLGKLEDGVPAEQLLEVLGDKNKEENAEEVQATLVECLVMLGRADNKDNADNARLNITFSCNNVECQTLEEVEPQMNSHLVEFGTEEAKSCLPCKRQFKCADDLMDHIKWYHKTGSNVLYSCRQVLGLTFVTVQDVLAFTFARAMYNVHVDYSSIIIPTVLSDLIHLLH